MKLSRRDGLPRLLRGDAVWKAERQGLVHLASRWGRIHLRWAQNRRTRARATHRTLSASWQLRRYARDGISVHGCYAGNLRQEATDWAGWRARMRRRGP